MAACSGGQAADRKYNGARVVEGFGSRSASRAPPKLTAERWPAGQSSGLQSDGAPGRQAAEGVAPQTSGQFSPTRRRIKRSPAAVGRLFFSAEIKCAGKFAFTSKARSAAPPVGRRSALRPCAVVRWGDDSGRSPALRVWSRRHTRASRCSVCVVDNVTPVARETTCSSGRTPAAPALSARQVQFRVFSRWSHQARSTKTAIEAGTGLNVTATGGAWQAGPTCPTTKKAPRHLGGRFQDVDSPRGYAKCVPSGSAKEALHFRADPRGERIRCGSICWVRTQPPVARGDPEIYAAQIERPDASLALCLRCRRPMGGAAVQPPRAREGNRLRQDIVSGPSRTMKSC